MIALSSDHLLFQLPSGESVPFSAEMVSVEVLGAMGPFDPEFVKQAAASVFHYFKHDLGRKTITVAEFAEALEKVLRGLGLKISQLEEKKAPGPPPAAIADLRLIARECGSANELFFYPRLREQIRAQLQKSPVVRFRGLRGCVKQLAGARRWSPRCEKLHSQILDYLRKCLSSESPAGGCRLMVD